MHALRLVSSSRVSNRRRSKRCVLDRRTSADLWIGDRRFACIIEDVSLGGVRLRFDNDPPDDEQGVLRHPVAGDFPGWVVWTGEGVCGFQFCRAEHSLERELQCVALMISSDDTQSDRRPIP